MDLVPPVSTTSRLWKNKADFFRPWRTAALTAASAARGEGEGVKLLYDPSLHRPSAGDIDEPSDLRELNTALAVLVELFPLIDPEVFREMLRIISPESRVQLVTEHILKQQAKGVVSTRLRSVQIPQAEQRKQTSENTEGTLALEDTFRSETYRTAVRQVFYQEFRNLSHSTVKGVMAEHNNSYTHARPVLQQIAAKSWRFSLIGLWSRKAATAAANTHPYIIWSPDSHVEGLDTPAVRRTGSPQLDHELHMLFVAPIIASNRLNLLASDHQYATKINEAEAQESNALFDCECCYDSVPFEQLTTCDTGFVHQLCISCVRRTAEEALYGQGWARTVDLEKSTIRCFAPVANSQGCCDGAIASTLVRQALRDEQDNEELWQKFQIRVANDVLRKSRVPLHRCPFCEYAEVADPPTMNLRNISQIYRHLCARWPSAIQAVALGILFMALTFLAIPLLGITAMSILFTPILPALHLNFSLSAPSWLRDSYLRVQTSRHPLSFTCRAPSCARKSCTRCLRPWRDPHTCFDAERTSLRTALESAATSAITRTCPSCRLSFVKASGCNKLVCPCGYAMCYLCRQQISGREGYSHFCPHFRPSGRSASGGCSECDKCDLYADEDERTAVRNAVGRAEAEWRTKFAGMDGSELDAQKSAVEALIASRSNQTWWLKGLDAIMDAVVA
ncbi:E3 ubiquitin-protein ligase [Acrodontium crateriforme]|uniref:E3 ubiquitin-protein ligase n=1 Tax=Acrodontium crateriforme TaxID=150365 RepID=A0AAQ3R6W5_9PEZI|nr:E3 ubiquitin-protein ligase [Acrodontium crateriforme]